MVTPTIVVDDRCIMAGECIYNHPAYFAWNDDDSAARVIRPAISTDADRTHADQAMSTCPSGAISISISDADRAGSDA